jgi:hypothetical protein
MFVILMRGLAAGVGSTGQPSCEERSMAHAKDKGGKDKHVKKKAQHSIKEKRAAKKLKKGSTQRSTGLQLPE